MPYEKLREQKMDEKQPFLCNNIFIGWIGASPKATQENGRYVVCDVTDLTCFGRRLNPVLLEISLTSFKK